MRAKVKKPSQDAVQINMALSRAFDAAMVLDGLTGLVTDCQELASELRVRV
jgi:hypothetical protein